PAGGLPAGPVVVGLALAVETALDLVARRRHAGGEALAEQAHRDGDLSGAARSSACATGRPTRCRPRRAPGAPWSAPAARWRRSPPAARPPGRPSPPRSPRPPGAAPRRP